MAFHDRDRKDFNAGLLYIAIGGFFGGFATNYPMGTAVRMGPAYFPTILGWILAILGAILLVRSFFAKNPEQPLRTHWRPLICIVGAAALFGYLVNVGGLVAASMVMMLVGAFGGFDFRWKEQLISAVVMTAMCVGIFVYGLGLPFKLMPWS
jgi:hypothetical protein